MPPHDHQKESMNNSGMHTVFISVGANLGDKMANCRFGIARLTALPGVTACTTSPFYRTAPVDYFDQDWFVNAAVRIATRLAPLELLEQIEHTGAKADFLVLPAGLLLDRADLFEKFQRGEVCRDPYGGVDKPVLIEIIHRRRAVKG